MEAGMGDVDIDEEMWNEMYQTLQGGYTEDIPTMTEEELIADQDIILGRASSSESSTADIDYDEEPGGRESTQFMSTYQDYERTHVGGGDVPSEFTQASLYGMTEKEILTNRFLKEVDKLDFLRDEDDITGFKKHVLAKVEPIVGVKNMNLKILISAAYFLWTNNKIQEDDIKYFLKDKKISPVDFVRYLRFLKKFTK